MVRNLPAGPFDLVLADPPWAFSSNSIENPGRNPRRHYPTMDVAEIAGMPVASICAPDALLLLWATVPCAHHAFAVMQAWGFGYVSQVVWVKDRIATGYWARNRHELLLIGKRGRFSCPRPALFGDSVITGQQREHSRKPDAVQQILDQRLPFARKVELFGRSQRPGWHVWGNQIDRFEAGAFDQRRAS